MQYEISLIEPELIRNSPLALLLRQEREHAQPPPGKFVDRLLKHFLEMELRWDLPEHERRRDAIGKIVAGVESKSFDQVAGVMRNEFVRCWSTSSDRANFSVPEHVETRMEQIWYESDAFNLSHLPTWEGKTIRWLGKIIFDRSLPFRFESLEDSKEPTPEQLRQFIEQLEQLPEETGELEDCQHVAAHLRAQFNRISERLQQSPLQAYLNELSARSASIAFWLNQDFARQSLERKIRTRAKFFSRIGQKQAKVVIDSALAYLPDLSQWRNVPERLRQIDQLKSDETDFSRAIQSVAALPHLRSIVRAHTFDLDWMAEHLTENLGRELIDRSQTLQTRCDALDVTLNIPSSSPVAEELVPLPDERHLFALQMTALQQLAEASRRIDRLEERYRELCDIASTSLLANLQLLNLDVGEGDSKNWVERQVEAGNCRAIGDLNYALNAIRQTADQVRQLSGLPSLEALIGVGDPLRWTSKITARELRGFSRQPSHDDLAQYVRTMQFLLHETASLRDLDGLDSIAERVSEHCQSLTAAKLTLEEFHQLLRDLLYRLLRTSHNQHPGFLVQLKHESDLPQALGELERIDPDSAPIRQLQDMGIVVRRGNS
ncbi:hypothetical protein LOC68_01730 [Blastopirellula sp. JC732]|uniref:Uncharacterized protein n=1 Tax=Blastopirellula sediminis TaxID=2894196 RepID=A0A9X1SDX0_9BACT|nr:hypothetical protein [Blastopirellula sediminis]MCC9608092.1 hypothetical protein [Blastopirellula sediminis]MCC9627115.1 hypothetical protein [Blastopirellula sediminis]